MDQKVMRMFAFLLSFLLILQLSVVSFAKSADQTVKAEAKEAVEEDPEDEDEEAAEDDAAFEEDEDEDEDEDEEAYYVYYTMDGFSFLVDWNWDKDTEDLGAFQRVNFTVDKDFSIHAAMFTKDDEDAIQELLYDMDPDTDPDDPYYAQKQACFLCGIDYSPDAEYTSEIISPTGYETLSDARFWYLFDDMNCVKGGTFCADDYVLILAADCTELTPAQDTALMHALSTVYWYGPKAGKDEDESENDETEESAYEKYNFNGFTFEISPDWEAGEAEEVYTGCSHMSFAVDEDFSISMITIDDAYSEDLMDYIYNQLPDLDMRADEAPHRISCFLCGVDCPSGKKLNAPQLDITDSYSDLYSALVWFIYDQENYVKGGAFSVEESGIIIAADCSEYTPEHDAAITRVLSTIGFEEGSPEEEAAAQTYEEIDVPYIEEAVLEIDPITPNTYTADSAEILSFNGEMTAKEQKDVYSFTAPYDGRYRVEMSDMKSGIEIEIKVFDSMGNKLATSSYATNGKGVTLKGLTAGETYEIRLKQSRGFGTYTLNIGQQKDTIDISELTALTDSMEFTEQRNVYEFTPVRDGRYRFELTNTKSGIETELYVYNSLDEKLTTNSYCTNGKGVTVKNMSADETYRVIICQHKNFGDYTLMIGQQKETVDITDLTLLSDSIEYTDQRNVYSFTVPRDGRYRFELAEMKSGVEVELYVFNDLGEKVAGTDYGSNGKGLTLKGLIAGDTYSVQVRQKNKTGSYQLLIGQQKETLEIGDHFIIHDSMEYTDQRNVYAFTAEKDGDYTFAVSGMNSNMEVELIVFNHLGEAIKQNSYCRNNGYISIKEVSAGDYFEIQVRQSSKLGDYTLTVN